MKVFLCDLTHTSQGINSELIPYAIGCILSYFNLNGSCKADISLYKYPDKFAKDFAVEKPEVVGFANYMWNLDLSYSFAKEIKKVSPNTLIVFGGPNYPLEEERQKSWLAEHPAVDVYVTGEGEEPFRQILELWNKTKSIDAVKCAMLSGVHAISDEQLYKKSGVRNDGYDDTPRVARLDETPSPYTMGYLDEFLRDPLLVPLMESNRGCPFTCAFCVDGIGARNKVIKVGIERLKAELSYIVERYSGKYLTLADTNFGMYKEDVEFCKVLAESKIKYDYPHHLQVSTGKNKQARIIACADLLKGSLRLSASVQSLDAEVLKNTKRTNISYKALIDVSSKLSDTQANTYSEVILGLPSDSKDKFINSVCGLIEAKFNQIRMFTLMILDGSDLATNESREKFKMKTQFRVVPRSFGTYDFMGKKLPSVEIEEVCVEQETLSIDDYVECRRFALTVTLFYNDRIFYELMKFLQNKGMSVSDWVKFIHGRINSFPRKLNKIYEEFTIETANELSSSNKELEERLKSEPGLMESYINGEEGNNILFNTQALAYLEVMEEMHDMAFEAARDFIGLKKLDENILELEFLTELKRYSLAKKQRFVNLDDILVEHFSFDFIALESQGFINLIPEKKQTDIKFYYKKWQKDFFSDQMAKHGTSLQGLGKLLSRVPIKKTQRSIVYLTNNIHEDVSSSQAESISQEFGPVIN